MPKKSQLVIAQQLIIEEHLFAGARRRDQPVVGEHGFLHALQDKVVGEHLFGGKLKDSPVGEHLFAAQVETQSWTHCKVKLQHPHHVSSVTVERRADGSLFLTLDE